MAPPDTFFPTMDITHYVPEVFGSYCGAGTGIGDLVVPETMWGLVVTLACYIHDEMWEHCEATWEEFNQSNDVFFRNLRYIVRFMSQNKRVKHLRMYRVVTYYNAVDAVGPAIFEKLKKKQGKTLVASAFIKSRSM